jgi:hypothetical protein
MPQTRWFPCQAHQKGWIPNAKCLATSISNTQYEYKNWRLPETKANRVQPDALILDIQVENLQP